MISTPRLLLRAWKDSDREPFASLNADPEVMEFFPALLSRSESDGLVDRINTHLNEHGFTFFAAELKEDGTFIGFIGMARPTFKAHFTPCVEIGWRLARPYWNLGLATEGAKAILRYGFEQLKLAEIVSFAVAANLRSRRVMERIGMTYDPADDFDHPNLPAGHPLSMHVLYREAAR